MCSSRHVQISRSRSWRRVWWPSSSLPCARAQRGANRLMYGERDDPMLCSLAWDDAWRPPCPQGGSRDHRGDGCTSAQGALRGNQTQARRRAVYDGRRARHPEGRAPILPLVYQRETVGNLIVAPRAPGGLLSGRCACSGLSPPGRGGRARRQAHRGPATLQGELVTTREEERRRARDLHDGLGPTLGYLTLGLDTACRLFTQDPKGAEALLLGSRLIRRRPSRR